MRKTLIAAVLFLAASQILGAQTFPALNVPSDARSLAMARVSEMNSASFLAGGKTLDAYAGYASWAPSSVGTSIVSGRAHYRFGSLAAGVNFRSHSEQPYDITNDNGIITGSFSPKEFAFGLSVAYDIKDMISVGAAFKSVSMTLGQEAKASGVAFDVNAVFHTDAIKAELAVKNLGGGMDFGSGVKNSLPALASVSGEYALPFGLKLGAEVDMLFAGGIMAGVGAEYSIAGMAHLRAGYHYGDAQKAIPSYASLGGGVELFGAEIDFAYLIGSENLSGSMMIGVGYKF